MPSPRKRHQLEYKRRWARAKRRLNATPAIPLPEVSEVVTATPREDHISVNNSDTGSESSSSIESDVYLSTSESEAGDNLDQPLSDENSPVVSENELDEAEDNAVDGRNDILPSASEVISSWALRNNITHNALDELLVGLKDVDPQSLRTLPKTARTLLRTNREVTTVKIGPMEVIHVDIAETLHRHLRQYPREVIQDLEVLHISLNADGIPVYNSSNKNFWPLLCSINLSPKVVFPLMLSYGPPKPKTADFLTPTINSLQIVLENGLQFEDRVIRVVIDAVIADAPARALLKGTISYSGYNGCDKCSTTGRWWYTLTPEEREEQGRQGGGRMTFQQFENLPMRTNESFRRKEQESHHLLDSPMLCLDIDMILDFPIDYMHQICLGVMKKLIEFWIPSQKAKRHFSATDQGRADLRLIRMKPFISRDFARKPRPLSDFRHWKATEFRQFLLYTGWHVMKGILPERLFRHFTSFSVACCILVSPALTAQYVDYAKELMVFFVKEAKNIYGGGMLSYNMHAMLHVADEAVRYGSLDEASAFRFENHLYQLKRRVRPGRHPLTQAYNRLCELSLCETPKNQIDRNAIQTKSPNNHYITEGGRCVSVVSVEGDGQVLVDTYGASRPLFEQPCDSKVVGIHFIPGQRVPTLAYIPKTELKLKAIRVSKTDGYVFHAILHSLD